MLAVDKDLRHGAAALRALDHLGAAVRLLVEADLVEGDPLFLQQRFGARAVGAPHRRIDVDLGHLRSLGTRSVTYGAKTSGLQITALIGRAGLAVFAVLSARDQRRRDRVHSCT